MPPASALKRQDTLYKETIRTTYLLEHPFLLEHFSLLEI
ncbi:uncharacterized protein G2W53_020480 [Senna tora]|uniref:Uncharacterized protein n=1 Tax=Senna tora TaxID=362788 RepID=A0A834TZT0_9FABA|nr:uncharacterized protein G2W53_020480 [Senna tora]